MLSVVFHFSREERIGHGFQAETFAVICVLGDGAV